MKTFILFLFFSTLSFAGEQKMALITSEFDEDIKTFYLMTDDHQIIEGIRYVTTRPPGGIVEDRVIPAEEILNGGVVLEERNGMEAVRLGVERFSLERGGTIKLTYLFNGITGERKVHRLLLKKNDQHFLMTDLAHKNVNRLFLVANRSRIFGIVGIKEILTYWSDTEDLSVFFQLDNYDFLLGGTHVSK